MNQEFFQEPRLLVIDPDESAAEPVVSRMSERGWRVDYARTLNEALDRVTNSIYNFVILELVLPDGTAMDAWELIHKINPDTFGVITTSSPTLYRSVNPRLPGILAFMLKPFDLGLIRETAAHLLEYQRVRAENQKLERKLIGLGKLASSLSATLTPTEALKTTVAQLASVLQADWVLLYLLDKETKSWSLRMTNGVLTFGSDSSGFLPFAEDLMSEVVETLLPTTLNDRQIFDAREGVTSLDQVHLGAIAVTPILTGAKVLGALTLARGPENRNAFSNVEVQFLALASHIIGLTLTNLRLAQQAHEHGIAVSLVEVESATQEAVHEAREVTTEQV